MPNMAKKQMKYPTAVCACRVSGKDVLNDVSYQNKARSVFYAPSLVVTLR